MPKQKAQTDDGLKHLSQRIAREGTLIAAFLLGLFLLIALISYSPDDPAFTTTGAGGAVNNAVGHMGAWLADVLLHLFGYFAYVFPFALGFKIIRLFRQSDADKAFSAIMLAIKTGGIVLLVVGACTLATMHFAMPSDSPWPAGGLIGAAMADASVPVFALLGSTLLFLALFLFGLTVLFEISWLRLVDQIGYWTLHGWAKGLEAWQVWREKRREAGKVRQAVERRHKALEVRVEKDRKRTPPRIEPVVSAPPARSQRVEKERQTRLFSDDKTPGELPAIGLLDENKKAGQKGYSAESLEAMSKLLELKLQDFGVEVEVTSVHPGPVITRFEVQPAPGVKASRITGLARDLARSLAVVSVRVVEVIPGKTVIGIEIPNEHREMIMLSQVLASPEFDKAQSALSMALGHDIVGKPVIVDLAKMPHLLVAGTTGSGKSVGINAMILSLLYKSTPEHVRMIMIDPKMLELSVYDGIPHLLTPVVTDMKDAANALRWSVAEMERRYKLMSALGVRNLSGYNKKVQDANKAGQPIPDPVWRPDPMALQDDQEAPMLEELPNIVVIVDELADMMMVVGKKVEELIARIAQKARAAGIHLILATQRPSVDVLTGLIKANIPTRLSFMVQSKVDSRTILGEGGAEQLLGNGDMLFLPPGGGLAKRVHGAFVSDEEVHRVVADWKSRGEPVYIEEITQGVEDRDMNMGMSSGGGEGGEEDDALYDEAVAFVTESRKASISAVQRKLRIGYNRAARMIEAMEAAGVVSEMGSNGSREVLAPPPPR